MEKRPRDRRSSPVLATMDMARPAPRPLWSAALALCWLAGCSGADVPLPAAPTEPSARQTVEFAPSAPGDGDPMAFVSRGGPVSMTVPTYDGSGEAVHPDVVTFPREWNGHRFWSAFTPYRNSAIALENPSVLASADGLRWDAPATDMNPLVHTSRGHLSDPDMIFEPRSQQLWMYYREVELAGGKPGGAHVADHVWLTRSDNGGTWQTPVEVFADKGRYVVSPSVVLHPTAGFRLFAVDAGTGGCSSKSARIVQRRSEDGITWGEPQAVDFSQPGYLPWHLDVQYVPARGEYWALVVAYPAAKGCHASSLFLATSPDGQKWRTFARPVLSPREYRAFSATVYRSSFSYDAVASASTDSMTIWYSGARQVKRGSKRSPAVLQWSLATTRTSVSALLAHVADPTGAARLTLDLGGDGRTIGVTPP